MSTVKELMLTDGTVTEPDDDAGAEDEPALDEDDEEAEDEQPAATMAVIAATATQPNLGSDLNVPWPCERECHPPSPLLRRSIPDPFRHHALRYDDVGHGTTRVSFRDER